MKHLKSITLKIFMPVFLLALLAGCGKSEYQRMEERELARGIREDSLFLGIYLGMPKDEFHTHCWNLNQQKVILQGTGANSVEYKVTEMKQPATMNFYPDFADDKIYQMPVLFSYDTWAPWNKSSFADSLQFDVIHLFEKWYGEGFIKVEHPGKVPAYVKIDGNRRILVSTNDDRAVKAVFTDLLAIRKMEKELAENK